MSQGEFNMDEINLCKDCKTMRHLNSWGVCGRCASQYRVTYLADPVAVQEWMESLGFHKAAKEPPETTYYPNDLSDKTRPSFVNYKDCAFFYNVVQQQMVAARMEELADMIRISHSANRIPVIEAWAENRIAELQASLTQYNAPEGGEKHE